MRSTRVAFSVSLLLVALVAVNANAQATRTWVSGTGDDINPCSRTAPCKTFAGAIAKTAAGGEIDVLDPGGYGAVTINKSLTIDGKGQAGGVLTSGTFGITVNAGVNDIVTIRDLSIFGVANATNGVRFFAGRTVILDKVKIYGFQRGILVDTASGNTNLVVRDSHITNNDPYNALAGLGGGIVLRPSGGVPHTASLDNVNLDRNALGIKVQDGVKMSGSNLRVTTNQTSGIELTTTTVAAEVNIESSMIAHNGGAGVQVTSGPVNTIARLSNTFITGNNFGLLTSGVNSQIISHLNNWFQGNNTNGAPTSTISGQ